MLINAVITRKLSHGLESLEATEAVGRLLDAFQLQGLRKIMTRWTTSLPATIPLKSTEFVYKHTHEVLHAPSQGPFKMFKTF